MRLSMRIKSGQKYTATSQESNDRVTPLFKRLESVWHSVAIHLSCADCEVSKWNLIPIQVSPHTVESLRHRGPTVPNHMKYARQGS